MSNKKSRVTVKEYRIGSTVVERNPEGTYSGFVCECGHNTCRPIEETKDWIGMDLHAFAECEGCGFPVGVIVAELEHSAPS